MRRSGSCLVVSAFVLGALAATAVPTSAQQAAPPATSESAQYRALIEGALDEFNREHWTEAYALFMQAHALEPSARTLRGMAACAFEARQYLRAIEYMRAALSYANKPLDDVQRREGNDLIERAEVFVARATLAIQPAEARIEVDSVPAERDDQGRLLLDPGLHQIAFSRPGYVTETRSVNVNPGDTLHIALQLAPSVPPLTTAASATTTPHAHDAQGAPARAADAAATAPAQSRRTWAFITAGAGVALAGTGFALFFLGRDGVQDVEHACIEDGCSNAEVERRIDDRHLDALQGGSIVAFALAGASAVVSALLFANGADESETKLSATARGASIEARF
jgi:tetratricopeptide (TPR) repeat protein